MPTHQPDHPERFTWQQVQHDPAGPCPDELELAAYADRRLDADAHDAVERHLVACAPCRTAVSDVIEASGDANRPMVPTEVIEAACNLVGRGRGRGRPTPWVLVGRWAVAAAACIAMGLLGYEAGFASGPSHQAAANDIAFGVFDEWSNDDLLATFSAGEDW